MKILTLLTDFGTTDYYVAAVKGTVLGLVPPPPPALVDLGHEVAGRAVHRAAACYDELEPGEAGLLPGSLGTLELSLRGESLAERWQVERGAGLRVELR